MGSDQHYTSSIRQVQRIRFTRQIFISAVKTHLAVCGSWGGKGHFAVLSLAARTQHISCVPPRDFRPKLPEQKHLWIILISMLSLIFIETLIVVSVIHAKIRSRVSLATANHLWKELEFLGVMPAECHAPLLLLLFPFLFLSCFYPAGINVKKRW